MTVIILDQSIALKKKFSRPKKWAESAYTRREFLSKGNEIYPYARLTQITTAAVLHRFFDLNRALEAKMRVCIRQ